MHDGTKGPIEHQPGYLTGRTRILHCASSWYRASHSAAAMDETLAGDSAGLELLQHYHEAMDDLAALDGGGADEATLGAFYHAVVQPLRRSYAWSVPSRAALECIAHHSPHGVVEIGAGTGYWAHVLRSGCGVDVVAYDETPCIDGDALGDSLGSPDVRDPSAGRDEVLNGFHALAGVGNALPFAEVRQGDASMAAAHRERALLLCWPPKEVDEGARGLSAAQAGMAADALAHFDGTTVLYVGCYSGEDSPEATAAVGVSGPATATEDGGGGGASGNGSDAAKESALGRLAARADTAGRRFHTDLRKHFTLVESVALPGWPQARDWLTVWQRRCESGELAAGGTPPTGDALKPSATVHTHGVHFELWSEDVQTELDRVTRCMTLALLRSSFDRTWMTGLTVRALTERVRGRPSSVSDAERRMLRRCVERMPPPWMRRVGEFVQYALR